MRVSGICENMGMMGCWAAASAAAAVAAPHIRRRCRRRRRHRNLMERDYILQGVWMHFWVYG